MGSSAVAAAPNTALSGPGGTAAALLGSHRRRCHTTDDSADSALDTQFPVALQSSVHASAKDSALFCQVTIALAQVRAIFG